MLLTGRRPEGPQRERVHCPRPMAGAFTPDSSCTWMTSRNESCSRCGRTQSRRPEPGNGSTQKRAERVLWNQMSTGLSTPTFNSVLGDLAETCSVSAGQIIGRWQQWICVTNHGGQLRLLLDEPDHC